MSYLGRLVGIHHLPYAYEAAVVRYQLLELAALITCDLQWSAKDGNPVIEEGTGDRGGLDISYGNCLRPVSVAVDDCDTQWYFDHL